MGNAIRDTFMFQNLSNTIGKSFPSLLHLIISYSHFFPFINGQVIVGETQKESIPKHLPVEQPCSSFTTIDMTKNDAFVHAASLDQDIILSKW